VDPAVEFRSRIAAVEGKDYEGEEGIREYFQDLTDAFREWQNEVAEVAEVSPDAVLVKLIFRGVGRESGMEVELASAAVVVIADGKVARFLAYPTAKEALQAAGLSP
jgi:ketosteroid isomerase-like protein